MLDEHLAGLLLFPESVLHKDPVWAVGGDYASGSMVWPCVSHPLCHLNRRRVAWWLSSRHIWMILRCLRVWQWLALLTVSSLIHLVQRVCVLEIGRHLILSLPLLSACLASVSLCAPMTCLMYNHFHIVNWIYFCACRYCRTSVPTCRHVVIVSYLYLPGELKEKKCALWESLLPCLTTHVLLFLTRISTGRNTDLICEDNNPLDFGD